jgi:hypothetical protein
MIMAAVYLFDEEDVISGETVGGVFVAQDGLFVVDGTNEGKEKRVEFVVGGVEFCKWR